MTRADKLKIAYAALLTAGLMTAGVLCLLGPAYVIAGRAGVVATLTGIFVRWLLVERVISPLCYGDQLTKDVVSVMYGRLPEPVVRFLVEMMVDNFQLKQLVELHDQTTSPALRRAVCEAMERRGVIMASVAGPQPTRLDG